MDAEAAIYWLGWLRVIQLIAVFLVAIDVAAEFAGEWISRPLERIIETAREGQIEELKHDTARLTKDADDARASIAEANARRIGSTTGS